MSHNEYGAHMIELKTEKRHINEKQVHTQSRSKCFLYFVPTANPNYLATMSSRSSSILTYRLPSTHTSIQTCFQTN